jgi:2-polyprenyl-3-methyl-5-hydroxy-6-metoxy-1,4-benzoquinol methylase
MEAFEQYQKRSMMMEIFLPETDDLSRQLNSQANNLLQRLKSLDVDALKLPFYCQEYFKSSHSTRLFFSIQTSARLLFRACQFCEKKPADICIMDYGAGVGTLYLLAGMSGFQKVIYNDHLEDWKLSAEKIATAIGIAIDEYIVGDIDVTLKNIKEKNISLNLIVSRNVLEHIYKPGNFFASIRKYFPNCVVFSSTTANAANPASVFKHQRWHSKWEKEFLKQRMKIILERISGMNEQEASELARTTRGLAMEDLDRAIEDYRVSRKLPELNVTGSNTCDPANGVWFENLLPFSEWRQIISKAGFNPSFQPGFWDTHYKASWKNVMGRLLNNMSDINPAVAMTTAPFIYIIAKPGSHHE